MCIVIVTTIILAIWIWWIWREYKNAPYMDDVWQKEHDKCQKSREADKPEA